MSIQWKNDKKSWGWVEIVIHWLTAVCVIGIFILGLWMGDLPKGEAIRYNAYFIHKSIGVSLLLLTIFRLIFRIFSTIPDPLPNYQKIEITLSKLMHKALYVLLLAVTLSGYFIVTSKGNPVSVFGLFDMPPPPEAWRMNPGGDLHLFLASCLIGFASLHAAAAIKHHFISKDSTLRRMLGKK